MKRVVFCLLALALLPFAVFTARGAHSHDFVLVTETPATCTAQGASVYACSCGETKTETIPALGHDFALTWTVDREPTCDTPGLKTRHCSRCDAVTDLLTIKQTNHDFLITTIEPTCTTAGSRHLVCQNCGKEMDDNIVPALGHAPGLWIVEREASCETDGLRSRSCTRCGEKLETVPIQKTGHVWKDTVVAPTCTEAGYTLHTCRACGATKQDHTVKATDHSPAADAVLTKAPTCTEKGEQRARCTTCGETVSVSVPALGHLYSDTPTVDKQPTCTAKGEQSRHCLRCGARKDVTAIERTAHQKQKSDLAATCTKGGTNGRVVCAVCGKELESGTATAALGHNYIQTDVQTAPTCTAVGSAIMRCTRCGAEKRQTLAALGHQYGTAWVVDRAPTCTAQGEKSHVCVRCGKRADVTSIPKKEHRLVYDVVVAPTCTEPGQSSGAHCADCGKVLESAGVIPATGHDYAITEVYTEPTCTKAGSGRGRCTVCGAQADVEIPARGHSFETDWTVDKQPTCTAQGEQSHHCAVCGKRKDVTTLPRKAHTVVVDKGKDATCTRDGKTAGSHCAVCGKVLEAQTVLKAPGHKLKTARTPATLKTNGKIVKTCKRCGRVVSKEKICRVKSCKLEKARFAFDGKKKTPTVIIRDKKGNLLKEKRDYTLTMAKGRKQIGFYTVTVTFRRNYAGEKTLRFQIVPRRPVGLDASQTPTRITLSWEQVAGATGYAVYELVGDKRQKLCETETLYVRLNDRASGHKYTFVVVALTKTPDGILRSDDSAPKLTATKPAPLSLSATRSGQRAVLRWNNAGDCDYEIYYAPKKNGRLVCIGTTKGTTFTTGVYPHGRACFKVKAVVRSDTGVLSTQSSDVRQLWF